MLEQNTKELREQFEKEVQEVLRREQLEKENIQKILDERNIDLKDREEKVIQLVGEREKLHTLMHKINV